MDTQTEHLENHTARLTVRVEPERLEQAKKVAAQKLSRRLNIPGFRKGKAPYRVVVNYVGEGAILEDAVEVLGNEVYQEGLNQSSLNPYGPGQLEDVKFDDQPVFTFVVPLQPTVVLNDYRSVRLDYEEPVVSDEDVNRVLRSLQEQEAVIEESHRPVTAGNRIHADIDARLIVDEGEATATEDAEAAPESADGDEAEASAEADDETGHAEGEHDHHVDENTIIHQHDAVLMLNDDNVPVPGFIEALEGATVGERRVFDLTYPEDSEYGELAGKPARFDVTIKKIETVTLPALNDDLAARVTKDEEKPLSLLELRIRVRENLQRAETARYRQEYARRALDAIVEQADIQYPEAMVAEQVEQMLRQFDQDLRQRGLTLEDFRKIYNQSDEAIYNEYRPAAVRAIERGLVMREIAEVEGIEVSDEDVEAEIDRLAAQFGPRAADYKRVLSQPAMRDKVVNDLMNQAVMDRIADIARGGAPELPADAEQGETAAVAEPTDSDADVTEEPTDETDE